MRNSSPSRISVLAMAHLMFILTCSSKNPTVRLAARAFSLSNTPSRVVRPLVLRTSSGISAESRNLSLRASSPVGKDLDAALDDILGEAFLEAESPPVTVQSGNHIKGSHPIAENLFAKVSYLSSHTVAHSLLFRVSCLSSKNFYYSFLFHLFLWIVTFFANYLG